MARRARGFSLVEVVFATALMATGVAAVAQLLVLAGRAGAGSAAHAAASLAAGGKLAELEAAAITGLTPDDALDRNVEGASDAIDASGFVVPVTSADARFVRRWTVQPLAGPVGLLLVQVRVLPAPAARGVFTPSRAAGEVRLVAVRRSP